MPASQWRRAVQQKQKWAPLVAKGITSSYIKRTKAQGCFGMIKNNRSIEPNRIKIDRYD